METVRSMLNDKDKFGMQMWAQQKYPDKDVGTCSGFHLLYIDFRLYLGALQTAQ